MAKAVATALGLILLISLVTPIVASPDEVKWSRLSIPREGKTGNWVLASGSDIQHLTLTTDGTLYAYGKGLDFTLYHSIDNGYSWSYTGKVEDDIVAIATAPDDADTICYATVSDVCRSTDSGIQFTRSTG